MERNNPQSDPQMIRNGANDFWWDEFPSLIVFYAAGTKMLDLTLARG